MSDKRELSKYNSINNASEIAIKALISAVPALGGPISSIIGDIQSTRKQKRLVEFVNGLTNDLVNLSDHINHDFVSKEDFLDVFEQTSKKIAITRQKSKRDAFRNVLSNSVLSKNITYDEVEEFVYIIDRFREEHLFLLNILKKSPIYDIDDLLNNPKIWIEPNKSILISEVMRELLYDWNEEFILEIATVLENERLVKNFVNNYKTKVVNKGVRPLKNTFLTPKGVRFVSFISSPGKH